MTGRVVVTGYGVFTAFGWGEKALRDGVFTGTQVFAPSRRFDPAQFRTPITAAAAGDPELVDVLGSCADDAVDMAVFAAPLGQGALTAAKVAHLTGTTDFTLSDTGRQELKSFVNNGGTLIIDCCGGSTEFAKAAERELVAMFGDAATEGLAQPLRRDNPVFQLPEHRLDRFDYRKWSRTRLGESTRDPRLCGIVLNNRTAVYYSREDLSAGLVGEPVDGIYGYTPSVATDIMRNILLYAAHPEAIPKPGK